MRSLTITELLKLGNRQAAASLSPYDKYCTLLEGFGAYVDKFGARLTLENIEAIAAQLGCLQVLRCGYLCALVHKNHIYKLSEEVTRRTYIGVNVKTPAIYPLIYKIVTHYAPKNHAYAIEIPLANVVPVQLLITVFDKNAAGAALSRDFLKLCLEIPPSDRLPGIEGFSDGSTIPDLPLALEELKQACSVHKG